MESIITGELKSQVDSVWNASWTGGISNPLEVIEQITYLLFLKRLDDNQIATERKASRTGKHTVGRTEDRPKGPPDPAAWKLPSAQRQHRMRGIWRFAEPRTPAPKSAIAHPVRRLPLEAAGASRSRDYMKPR